MYVFKFFILNYIFMFFYLSEVTGEVPAILHEEYRFPAGQSEVYSREPECNRFWVGSDPVPDQLQCS